MGHPTETTDPGGRRAYRLRADRGEVLIAALGAQVLTWQHDGRDVLWSATHAEHLEGRPVRGGVPVVFPWFGGHRTDPELPAHGFARARDWQLVGGNDHSVTLALTDDADSRAVWPHAFRAELRVDLAEALHITLAVTNRGEQPFDYEEALHTYFVVGDIHTAAVTGLEGVGYVEHAKAPEPDQDPKAPIRFRAETDRVFQDVPDRIVIQAPALDRIVTLTTRSSRSTIVWNPWPEKTARLSQMAPDDWQRFVCVESANVHAGALRLQPGETHELALTIKCE
ncbi:MAG: D-hexose-6-phosphate mutarotase [bacterium]|nr:D-hexose-6-phosphate mutarotase [bacterium]